MSKTALDLGPGEFRRYSLPKAVDSPRLRELRERAWQVARDAARVLRERFGAQRVILFGSLCHPDAFGTWSDIDVAVWGVPSGQFYKAVATISGISSDFQVDLVDTETARPTLRQAIEQEGIEL